MKHRPGTLSPRKKVMIAGSVLLYILVLSAMLILAQKDASTESKAVFGSMEGRFLSDIVMQRGDEAYYYRENEITNYLVIGTDRENMFADAGYQNGGQADFLVILSIDRISKTVTPVMLDRDTMTPVQTYGVFGHPSGTRVMQLCLAQAYSGIGSSGSVNTAKAVEDLMYGIKIDHYIALDISAVPLVNDAIGGVEVTLQDDFTAYDPAMVKGATLRLSGEQAAYFVQGRRTVSDGTNASRMMRQQQYIDGFLTQLRRQSEADSQMLSGLLDAVSAHMQSDASQSVLLRDMNAYEGYLWQPMRALEGEHSMDEYNFAEFWADDDALQELVLDIWFSKEEHR